MRLLLDTHVLLWWVTEDMTIDGDALRSIAEADLVVVSAASVWELAIKQAAGRLKVPDDLDEQVDAHSFTALDITFAHARAAAALPRHHGDPFDRVLVAQAQIEGLTIVTRDSRIARYGVPTLAA